MTVAIDGPAGAGKSTIATMVADRFGYFNLNSGNFYRAVTLKVLDTGKNPEMENEVVSCAETCSMTINRGRLFLDGEDVDDLLHTDRVDRYVAAHSAIIPVRHIVNDQIRRLSGNMDIVAEGRDMTSVVFPDAEVKIYLDASVESRARRRFDQNVSSLNIEAIRKNIEERDYIDMNKPFGKLQKTEDACYLDTSDLTLEQVYEKVIAIVQDKIDSQEKS